MWKTYFQEEGNFVKVYGIDINDNCKELEEENVEIFIGSQDDRDFLAETAYRPNYIFHLSIKRQFPYNT